MEHEACCWLSGGPNVSSFLHGDVLVNGCEFWMIHGVCQADRLQGWQVQGPQDCVMVHGVVSVQYYLVFMSPLPFARCASLSASCSTPGGNLSPTSGK